MFRPEMHSGQMPLNYDELTTLVSALANEIIANYNPDVIIAVARGGLVPAVILSHLLGELPLIPIAVNYDGEKRHQVQRLPDDAVRGKRALIVDDITVRGDTIAVVRDECVYLDAAEIRTAVVILHPAAPRVDFYAAMTDAKPLFPWDAPAPIV